MKEKQVILSSDNLVCADNERGCRTYSDGRLIYRASYIAKHIVVGATNIEIEGDVVIPSEVTINGYSYKVIGIDSFHGCHQITNVRIPNSICQLDRSEFNYCLSLKTIFIHSNISRIKKGVWIGCPGLEKITVSDSNKMYDSRNNCNAIIETATNTLLVGCKNTIIPDSVTCIGDSAFMHNKSITRIVIPESVTEIGPYAFYGCINLKEVILHNGIKSIGLSAFGSCSSLTHVSIPWNVETISGGAFSGCAFESVFIPKTAKQWSGYAFGSGCLKSICVEKGHPIYDSRNDCNAIIETANNKLICGCQSTIIPDSITTIGSHAFETQIDNFSVTIPEHVSEIGQCAFSGCKNLTSVYSFIRNPSTCSVHISAFARHKNTAILYVPKGTADAYSASTDGWRMFKEIREYESDAKNNN